MDETKNTPAIILNRQSYRENDSLVTVYSLAWGKLTLVARGTKKLQSKLAGHIEPLTLADILIVCGRGFDYIGSAIMRCAYLGIRQDLNKLYYAGQAINLFNRLVKENQADERLFFLLERWLEAINNFKEPMFTKETGELFFSFFAWKLLAELGYAPEIYNCLSCKKTVSPGKNYFNLKNGGLVCEECFKEETKSSDFRKADLLTISDNCIKIIRFMMNSSFNLAGKLRIERKIVQELLNLANNFINFHFNI